MKRVAESDDEDGSDDDFGPKPVGGKNDGPEGLSSSSSQARKKPKKLPFEKTFMENLPSAEMYEHSFMHRDVVTHLAIAKSTEFLITGSSDGHVKFWKKMPDNIEFVKHFQAHLGALQSLVVSPDDKRLVTTSVDRMIKFFEVLSFDMSRMVSTDYVPSVAVWLRGSGGLYNRVAVGDSGSGKIRVYRADAGHGSQGNQALTEIDIHSQPVKCLALNMVANVVISADAKGVIEYWDAGTFVMPDSPVVSFQYKTETDLYDMAKAKTVPCTIAVSPTGTHFATTSRDKQIRLFDFKRGKLTRKYDESVGVYTGSTGSQHVGDTLLLGKKQAVERELEASPEALALCNVAFDESGNFLVYGSLAGIKILNVVTNRVVRVLGSGETGERFLSVTLYQGIPKVDTQFMLAKAGAEGVVKTSDQLQKAPQPDPTIYCTSFKKRRFYCFSTRPPDEATEARDVLNEMPTEEERASALDSTLVTNTAIAKEAILRTSIGDVHIKLFGTECPRTVENFTTHARNGYYDNVIFHRVIKGFMIQTGDPMGDGTGGESIWGGEFEDEFDRNLRHDRPFTLSMANSGPNTNGSQFFITTVPTPWLDNKHTVFGRVTKGFEVVSKIEGSRVNKYDKPADGDMKILGVETIL